MKFRYYAIILLVLTLLCGLTSPAFAAYSNGTAIISSNPTTAIQLTVQGGISNWSLTTVYGDGNIDSTSINMTIRSNTPWVISIQDALDGSKPSASAGNMTAYWISNSTYAAAGPWLQNRLKVRADDYSAYLELSGATQLIKSGTPTPPGGKFFPIWVNQYLQLSDTRLENPDQTYRIVVTFIGMNT